MTDDEIKRKAEEECEKYWSVCKDSSALTDMVKLVFQMGYYGGATMMQEYMLARHCKAYCKNCIDYRRKCNGLDFDGCEDVRCYRDVIKEE